VLQAEDGETVTLVVASARPYRDRGLVVAFEGVEDRDAAGALRGMVLTTGARRELGEGEFWIDDLVGLEAVGPEGARLGRVVAVNPGPQDRLVVETHAGHRVEVPFVAAIVGDPDRGRLPMTPPPGLFPDSPG
jgi:16S rRNA processing protein RimM